MLKKHLSIKIISFITFQFLILSISSAQEQDGFIIKENDLFEPGMYALGDSIVIDETEVLISEWLEFILYNNYNDYTSYINKSELTDSEQQSLVTEPIDFTLFPIEPISRANISEILGIGSNLRVAHKFLFVQGKIYIPVSLESVKDKKHTKILEEKMKTGITGISYEQAILYCRWRTEIDSLRTFKALNEPGFFINEYESYVYGLLPPDLYDRFLYRTDSLSLDGIYSIFNYKNATEPQNTKKNFPNLSYGKSLITTGSYYFSEKHGRRDIVFLDIHGNAAEMTTVKGIAKGGSYHHFASESMKGMEQHYVQPEHWLGFRCAGRRRPGMVPLVDNRLSSALSGLWICNKILDSKMQETYGKYIESGQYLKFNISDEDITITLAPFDEGLDMDYNLSIKDSTISFPFLNYSTIPGTEGQYKIRNLSKTLLILQTTNSESKEINYLLTRQRNYVDSTEIPKIIDCGGILIKHLRLEPNTSRANRVSQYIISTNSQLMRSTPVYRDSLSASLGHHLSINFKFPEDYPIDSLSKELIIDLTVDGEGASNFEVMKTCSPAIDKQIIDLLAESYQTWEPIREGEKIIPSRIRLHFYFYLGKLEMQ